MAGPFFQNFGGALFAYHSFAAPFTELSRTKLMIENELIFLPDLNGIGKIIDLANKKNLTLAHVIGTQHGLLNLKDYCFLEHNVDVD
jgi:hypothetical protein